MKDGQLIILFGTDDSIASFNENLFPKVNTSIKEDFLSLAVDYEKNDTTIESIEEALNTVEFVKSEKETKDVKNIFLFLETDDLSLVSDTLRFCMDRFKQLFSEIKFIYLTLDTDNVSEKRINEIRTVAKEYKLNTDLTELFDKSISEAKGVSSQYRNFLLKVNALYQLIDLTSMAYDDDSSLRPNSIENEIEFALESVFKEFYKL